MTWGSGVLAMSNDLVPSEPEDFEASTPEPFPMAEEAVRRFMTCGSLAQVGREMQIPVQDLYKASRSAWWIQEIGLRKRMEQAALDARYSTILESSLDALEERLIEGEDYFDKDGCKYKKKLTASTLIKMVEVLFDKRQLLRGLPTSNDAASGKLAELARKLEELGRAGNAKPIIDGDVSDATPK